MGVSDKNAQNNIQPKGNNENLKKPLQVLHINKKDTQNKSENLQNEKTNFQEEIKDEKVDSTIDEIVNAKKKLDKILISANAGIPYPKYFKAKPVKKIFSTVKDP